MNLEQIRLNVFIGEEGAGVNAAFVDVYADIFGSPGILLASELGFIPNDQVLVGNSIGFDIWELTLDISNVFLLSSYGSEHT